MGWKHIVMLALYTLGISSFVGLALHDVWVGVRFAIFMGFTILAFLFWMDYKIGKAKQVERS